MAGDGDNLKIVQNTIAMTAQDVVGNGAADVPVTSFKAGGKTPP